MLECLTPLPLLLQVAEALYKYFQNLGVESSVVVEPAKHDCIIISLENSIRKP